MLNNGRWTEAEHASRLALNGKAVLVTTPYMSFVRFSGEGSNRWWHDTTHHLVPVEIRVVAKMSDQGGRQVRAPSFE